MGASLTSALGLNIDLQVEAGMRVASAADDLWVTCEWTVDVNSEGALLLARAELALLTVLSDMTSWLRA